MEGLFGPHFHAPDARRFCRKAKRRPVPAKSISAATACRKEYGLDLERSALLLRAPRRLRPVGDSPQGAPVPLARRQRSTGCGRLQSTGLLGGALPPFNGRFGRLRAALLQEVPCALFVAASDTRAAGYSVAGLGANQPHARQLRPRRSGTCNTLAAFRERSDRFGLAYAHCGYGNVLRQLEALRRRGAIPKRTSCTPASVMKFDLG